MSGLTFRFEIEKLLEVCPCSLSNAITTNGKQAQTLVLLLGSATSRVLLERLFCLLLTFHLAAWVC